MTTQKLDVHGCSLSQAIAAFLRTYNECFAADGKPSVTELDIIHGYGSTGKGGVIRTDLRKFLGANADFLEFFPGEDIDENQGHTIVVPRFPLRTMY